MHKVVVSLGFASWRASSIGCMHVPVHSDSHERCPRLSNATRLGYTSLRQVAISLGEAGSDPGELRISVVRTADHDENPVRALIVMTRARMRGAINSISRKFGVSTYEMSAVRWHGSAELACSCNGARALGVVEQVPAAAMRVHVCVLHPEDHGHL